MVEAHHLFSTAVTLAPVVGPMTIQDGPDAEAPAAHACVLFEQQCGAAKAILPEQGKGDGQTDRGRTNVSQEVSPPQFH
jgi:hypothetical protein